MVRRLVLAYLLALPVFVVTAARLTEGDHSFRLTVRLASSVGGVLQVYADRGHGFSEQESYEAVLATDTQPHDYQLKIPSGKYSMFRIDPGLVAGRYTLYSVTIDDPHGVSVARPSLYEFQQMVHLTPVERTGDKLVMDTPPDPVDPQILWIPKRPLPLVEDTNVWTVAMGTLLMAAGALFGVVSLLSWLGAGVAERVERRLDAVAAAAGRRPRAAITAAAALGFLVSAYPVLFFGRSLFTPNNGANWMLYQQVPFTPGSTDVEVEDTRKSDVATGTWVFLPYSVIQRDALVHGEFPLWNRDNAGGRPLWGQGQSFLFDPLHWLTLIAPDAGLGLDLKYLAHRLVFAIGAGLLAFAVTGSWLSSAIVAASVPFLGLYNYRFNHPQPFALTYAPWVLLGWLRLASDEPRVRARGAAVLAVATTLVLYAASPKEAAVSLLSAYAVGAVVVVMAPGSLRSRAARLLWAAAAGGAALLATAPDWLVFAGTLPQSETAYDNPLALFGGAPEAVALFLGPVTSGKILAGYSALALVGLIAALSAPVRLWSRPGVLASAAGAAVLLAAAFGAIPAPLLVRLPLISRITHLHDVCLTAAAPLVLVVSAFGLDVLLSGGWLANSLVAAACGAAACGVSVWAYRLAPSDAFEPLAAVAVLSAAAVLPLVLASAPSDRSSAIRVVAAAIALAIVLLPGGLHLDTRFSAVNTMLFQPRPRVDYTRHAPVVDEIRAADEPGRTVGMDSILFPGSQGVYRLEGVNGVDALQLPRYERLADASGLWRGWFYFVRATTDNIARASKFLDLMNVRHLLLEPGQPVPGLTRVHVPPGDRLALGDRPSAWPRAFFVDGVSKYATLAEFMAQLNASHGPFASIDATDDRAASLTRPLGAVSHAAIPAGDFVLTPNSTTFRVKTPSAGVAVLTESYLPEDFVVTVNGRSAPYFRVNHAFKAVSIPAAGDWTIRMEYRPLHWRLSLAIGLTGALVLAALALRILNP
jgi:hypothetical protein